MLAAQTDQLAGEVAQRVTNDLTGRLEPLLLRLEHSRSGTPVPVYDESDQLLELDDF